MTMTDQNFVHAVGSILFGTRLAWRGSPAVVWKVVTVLHLASLLILVPSGVFGVLSSVLDVAAGRENARLTRFILESVWFVDLLIRFLRFGLLRNYPEGRFTLIFAIADIGLRGLAVWLTATFVVAGAALLGGYADVTSNIVISGLVGAVIAVIILPLQSLFLVGVLAGRKAAGSNR